jgi:hypothetical protein
VAERGNGGYVTWGRWEAEHHALTERVRLLEEAATARASERRARNFQLFLATLAGLLLPLAVIGTVAFTHYLATHF